MKKITVDKNEGIAEVIDRILSVEDSSITISIPKGSILAKSGSNFRLLKREADAAEKSIAIESTDETILDFAKENRIPNAHAFLKHNPGVGNVSDIVAREDAEDEESMRGRKKGASVRVPVRAERDTEDKEDSADDADGADEDEDDEEEEESKSGTASFFNRDRFFKERPATSRYNGDDDDDSGSRSGAGKATAWIFGIIIVLIAAFYILTTQFGHAQVSITFTQTPWSYQANFTADQSATAVDPATNVIPAQVFTTQKNITQFFPATGAAATVLTKAMGVITIYNDYSAAPQELVATTRFLTPNGQIFRITDNVTVPGAQVGAGGAITPSSVTSTIVADQGGSAYNVGPVAKLTIPGFAGTPRENGFYGSILGQTTGGFTGTKVVPTAGDIAGAKASTTAILQSDLQDGLTASYPNNFKILDGATDIQITKLIVNTSTDANGDFSVFGEASLTAIGFDEAAFTNYLLGLAQTTEASSSFKTVNLSYGDVQANFTKGQVSFALSAQGELEPSFSAADFASLIAGDSISTARSAISSLPQLSNGTISVWPMWLWSIPSNTNKISVTVN